MLCMIRRSVISAAQLDTMACMHLFFILIWVKTSNVYDHVCASTDFFRCVWNPFWIILCPHYRPHLGLVEQFSRSPGRVSVRILSVHNLVRGQRCPPSAPVPKKGWSLGYVTGTLAADPLWFYWASVPTSQPMLSIVSLGRGQGPCAASFLALHGLVWQRPRPLLFQFSCLPWFGMAKARAIALPVFMFSMVWHAKTRALTLPVFPYYKTPIFSPFSLIVPAFPSLHTSFSSPCSP